MRGRALFPLGMRAGHANRALSRSLYVLLERYMATQSASSFHPWRRFLARIVDYYLLGVLPFFGVVFIALLVDINLENILSDWFLVTANYYIVCILNEAFCLSTIGNTPGKWMFGILVRTKTGDKLSYMQAAVRAIRAYLQGLGMGIFYVIIFLLIDAYYRLSRTGTTLWDCNTGYVVTYK